MKRILRVFLASMVFAWLATSGAAHAEPNALDQKASDRLKSNPQAGLIFLEVTIAEPGEKTPKICQGMSVQTGTQAGKRDTIRVQEASMLFGKLVEGSTWGGIAVMDAGIYQVDFVRCTGPGGFVLRGPFAKFSLQAGQILNLGRLDIVYQQLETPLFAKKTFKGDWKVVDLTPRATASMTKQVPETFPKAKKQYMTAIRPAKP